MSNSVITISRQYGSGGHEIGLKLAQALHVPCHDKDIVENIANEKGYCAEIIDRFDEKPAQSLLYSLVMNSYGNWYSNDNYKPLQMAVQQAQIDIIQSLAKEPCVIIGRAADRILEDVGCVSIFVHADMATRIAQIMQRRSCSEKETQKAIAAIDRDRAQHYHYYSDKKWGDATNYSLSLDSGILGVDGSVELILSYLEIVKSTPHGNKNATP